MPFFSPARRRPTGRCFAVGLLVLLLGLASPAVADFEAGRRAYERQDYQAALEAWLPLAEAGNAEAQFWVGKLYSAGKGVEQDFDVAYSYYIQAALQGHSGAELAAGDGLILDDSSSPEQQALGVALLLRAATAGETRAYITISQAYCYGTGVDEDPVLADVWMVLALGPLSQFSSFLHCDVMTPLTREYHAEILRRAEGLRLAYGFTPYGSEPTR